MTATIISFADAKKGKVRHSAAPSPEKQSSIMLREIAAQLGLPPLPRKLPPSIYKDKPQ